MKATERFCVDLTKYANQDSFFDALDTISMPTITWGDNNLIPQEEDGIIFSTLDSIPEPGSSSQFRIPTIADLFCNTNSLLWGPSNTGKSFWAISLACSMATGSDFYFLKNSLPIKTAYLDAEISDEDFKARIIQMKRKPFLANPLLSKNLIHCDLHGKRLSDERVQDEICTYLKKQNTTHVILDNLLSTFPRAAKGSTDILFRFMGKLKSNGNGITIIHHANKDGGDFKGPTEFESLSQNVFKLYNSKQLLELAEKKEVDLPHNIEDEILAVNKQKQKSVVMMLEVIKCKASRALEEQRKFFVLPIQGELKCYDETGDDEYLPDKSLGVSSVVPSESELDLPSEDNETFLQSVSDFERDQEIKSAYDKIKAKCDYNEFKRAKLENITGYKTTKCSQLIVGLLKNDLAEKIGNGKQTRYKLKPIPVE